MGFRLVSKSVILSDLERRIMALILRHFIKFDIVLGAQYVKVVEDRPTRTVFDENVVQRRGGLN